jgi:hypothetical protein
MTDELATALIARLNPILYFIGLMVVLGLVSFGGTIISLWWKNRTKQEDKLESKIQSMCQALSDNTISISRIEAKLDLWVNRVDKDLNGLGDKIRDLEN